MAKVDSKSGEVVIRIVFDGPPEVGKTSTIDQLASMISLQRRSPVTRPGTSERRTEFFDWLDFAGGFLDGNRVRCQLISVPGQANLLHRRRYLLESADVIVFVADAAVARLHEVRASFQTTMQIATDHRSGIPVGLVLQLNKQDLPGTLSLDAMAAALEIRSSSVPIVGTSTRTGTGVMQTLILAVRLATERVRSLLLAQRLEELGASDTQPEALHCAMLALEPAVNKASSRGADPSGGADTAGARVLFRQLSAMPLRKNGALHSAPPLPQASALPAGCIWPAVSGRAALASANRQQLEAPATIADFAPADAFELKSENGWLFHSRPSWLFALESTARLALLSIARTLAESPDLLPEGRALLIGPEDTGWRLWMVTRQAVPIWELLADALDEEDSVALAEAWRAVVELASAGLGVSPAARGARLSALAAQRGRLVVLTLPENPASATTPLRELEYWLQTAGQMSVARARCIATARALVERSPLR
jgi:signal recognition particle receptor subunit beta